VPLRAVIRVCVAAVCCSGFKWHLAFLHVSSSGVRRFSVSSGLEGVPCDVRVDMSCCIFVLSALCLQQFASWEQPVYSSPIAWGSRNACTATVARGDASALAVACVGRNTLVVVIFHPVWRNRNVG
jgi:hypothetical protein